VAPSLLRHTWPVALWKALRSVVRQRPWHDDSVLAFLTLPLPLPLQRPLQKRCAIDLVRGGGVGNVDDVDREAARHAVLWQVGREIPGVGCGVGRP
jgi:hypothetical protein